LFTNTQTLALGSTFSCPSADEAGFAVGSTNTASNPIFCSFPAFSGENPDDFYCTYSPSTGALVTDNDAGFCPATAVSDGSSGTGSATSSDYTATATGTDYWVATYNGDANNGSVSSGAAAEPVTVTPAVAVPCTAGYYSVSGDAPCTPASSGNYVSGSGATSQTPCPLGHYQSQTGQSSCVAASTGDYVGTTGSSSQTACAPGYYQPATGQSSCIAAGLGYYVSGSGSASEVQCPPGLTTLVVASTSCVGPTKLVAAAVNKQPGIVQLSATLTTRANGKGLAGQTIVFKIGSSVLCTAVTRSNGTASCVDILTFNQFVYANSYTASYAGSGAYLPSTATGSFYLGSIFANIR
jgi:hypothetical protein